MTPRAAALSALLIVGLAGSASGQEPPLATVLQRAGAYVAGVERAVSGIVAEERYSQRWIALPRGWPLTEDQRQRELTSDLLIVNQEAAGLWMQFRDVFEVDGAPVRDRDERLMKLFLEPAGSTTDQMERILDESARYNIGNVERNVNTPLFAMLFLDPRHQSRFHFFRTRDRMPLLGEAGPADSWVVRFEERKGRAVIHSEAARELPSHGRFWIDPATGRVFMTELVAEDRTVRAIIVVRFRPEPNDSVLFPLAMRERYEGRTNKSVIEGAATYGRFRQFKVTVDMAVKK
jgi:hypothetical protein